MYSGSAFVLASLGSLLRTEHTLTTSLMDTNKLNWSDLQYQNKVIKKTSTEIRV